MHNTLSTPPKQGEVSNIAFKFDFFFFFFYLKSTFRKFYAHPANLMLEVFGVLSIRKVNLVERLPQCAGIVGWKMECQNWQFFAAQFVQHSRLFEFKLQD
jgi:hypothetical protein